MRTYDCERDGECCDPDCAIATSDHALEDCIPWSDLPTRPTPPARP